MSKIEIGETVKLSAAFLRSIGNQSQYAENKGKVLEVVDDWLAVVDWGSEKFSNVGIHNLVLLDEVAAEARRVEHKDALPGLVIGSNSFLKL